TIANNRRADRPIASPGHNYDARGNRAGCDGSSTGGVSLCLGDDVVLGISVRVNCREIVRDGGGRRRRFRLDDGRREVGGTSDGVAAEVGLARARVAGPVAFAKLPAVRLADPAGRDPVPTGLNLGPVAALPVGALTVGDV